MWIPLCPNESPLSLEISGSLAGDTGFLILVIGVYVGVSFPNWGFSVVVGCGVATKRRGVDFVIKKGVGGFAEGGRNGEERVRR